MRLGSSDISKSEKLGSDSRCENLDAVELSLNCGSESSLDGIVEKREYMVCGNETADDKLEDKNNSKGRLHLGARALVSMENMIGLCADREIEKERVGVIEVADLAHMNKNELDSGLKEEIKVSPMMSANTCQHKVLVSTSPHKDAMKCENQSENVERVSIAINTDVASGDADITKEKLKVEEAVFLNVESKKEEDGSSLNADDNGEGIPKLKKYKRGRKRKMAGNQECNANIRAKSEKSERGDIEVSCRVLRSRAMAMSGVVHGELNESVIGFKRKMEAECLEETEFQKEVAESTQVTGRLQKKKKRRGRPPKTKHECLNHTKIQKEGNETIQQKRGRPFKVQDKEQTVQEISKNKHKDAAGKNLKRRGRPCKVHPGNSITHVSHVTDAKNGKHTVVKKNNNQMKSEDVKEGPEIHNVQKEVGVSASIDENKQKIIVSDEGNDHPTVEDTDKQLKSSISGAERRKKQQLVRDQIVSMIMKAGWVIEYRPRQGKARGCMDAVYVDQNGRTHWSITKAYFSFKKKVEDGKANSEEVAAFTPVPDEELSVLFKSMTKVRSDKNKKKIKWTAVSKAKIIISGDAPPKKKQGKKSKDGTKRKQMSTSTINLVNNSSCLKVRGDKSQPKASQKSRQSSKPRLEARSSGKGLDVDNDGCTIYNGKRNILSWMIDLGVIMIGGRVQCGEGSKETGLLEGTTTCDGIHCSCCNKIMDLSKFVSHGGGKLTQTLKNIYFQSGTSLFKCLLESWMKEVESSSIRFNYVDVEGDDPNDDTCNICGDGGDLVCCDGCPSTFHQSCLDIQNFPSGDWHCTYCCCKFCGVLAGSATQMDDHAPSFELLSCCLCEEKFHQLCSQEEAVKVGSRTLSFCRKKCQELFEQLQKYLGVKFELKEGFSWTLLQRSDVSQDSKLNDFQKVECNSKLAVAFSVMDECFVPIMDERSGANMIHNVVYNCGSNFRRLNYSGFFTAILERGDELISAASIRVHGHRLAEMPFIGTRHMYRRQGMCRRLLDAIEHALGSLGVEELVIPAIPELYKTWTSVFGFKPLEDSIRQTMKCMSMIVFPGTDMLQKPLLKDQFADKSFPPAAISDEKSEKCITAVNDENAYLKNEPSNAIDNEQGPASIEESPITTFQVSEPTCVLDDQTCSDVFDGEGVGVVKTSTSTSKVVPKITFDLNLQPAATDVDIQPMDEISLSMDQQVCKNSFDLSESMAHIDNNDPKTCASQPLVLV